MKNIKITFLKDPHFFVGRNIRMDYNEVNDSKINEIIYNSKQHNVKNVFMAGDIFNKFDNNSISISRLKKAKKLLNIFKNNELNIFSIKGNHDYINGNENETHLEDFLNKDISIINDYHDLINNDEFLIRIHAVHYSVDKNDIVKRLMSIAKNIANTTNPNRVEHHSVIIHWNVFNDKHKLLSIIDDNNAMTYNDIFDKYCPNIDLLFVGHIHESYHDNPKVVNPAIIIRGNANEKDINPEMSIVEFYFDKIENKIKHNIEYIQLKHHISEIVFRQDYLEMFNEVIGAKFEFKFDTVAFVKNTKNSLKENLDKITNSFPKDKRNNLIKLLNKYISVKN